MSLTLKQQIFLGYLVMVLFTLIVGAYAIWGLRDLNEITADVIFADLKIGEKIIKLNDSTLAQDLYEKRFLTLQQADAENCSGAGQGSSNRFSRKSLQPSLH